MTYKYVPENSLSCQFDVKRSRVNLFPKTRCKLSKKSKLLVNKACDVKKQWRAFLVEEKFNTYIWRVLNGGEEIITASFGGNQRERFIGCFLHWSKYTRIRFHNNSVRNACVCQGSIFLHFRKPRSCPIQKITRSQLSTLSQRGQHQVHVVVDRLFVSSLWILQLMHYLVLLGVKVYIIVSFGQYRLLFSPVLWSISSLNRLSVIFNILHRR